MLKQHEFYVYHDENRVMARMGEQAPVVAETLETPQAAHDKAQAIINPTGKAAADFKEIDTLGREKGFHSAEFQDAISGNCEAYVKTAYKKKK